MSILTKIGTEARAGFEETSGLLILERKNLTKLATSLRSIGYKDLMLVSTGDDGIEFIASRPHPSLPNDNHALYLRQRYRDEHDPQNGKTVLIALDLTRSIDEQYVSVKAWERAGNIFVNGEPLTQDCATLAELGNAPMIDRSFEHLSSELIPDTAKNTVVRHTLPEILRTEQGLNAIIGSNSNLDRSTLRPTPNIA